MKSNTVEKFEKCFFCNGTGEIHRPIGSHTIYHICPNCKGTSKMPKLEQFLNNEDRRRQ